MRPSGNSIRSASATAIMILGAGSLLAFGGAPRTDSEAPAPAERQFLARTSRDVTFLPKATGCTVDPVRELFITDVSVVDDCYRTTWTGSCPPPVAPAIRGAWTFGGVIQGVFGTTDRTTLSNLVTQWLNQWMTDQTINGDTVLARPFTMSDIVNPWLAASGGATLDMTKAPFRLTAIVARLDMRQNAAHGGVETAGEGRFVFNLLDANGQVTPFNVILEYGLDALSCADVLNWAQIYHSLGSISFGPNFSAALQTITDRFTAINASPGKPNGSAVNQVRTNEIFFSDSVWEQREFHLSTAGGSPRPLLETTVALTPRNSLNHKQVIADFINTNTTAILANNYTVPLSFGGASFLGGSAQEFRGVPWDGPAPACSKITNKSARAVMSLGTCSGCHNGETAIPFTHVSLRQPGTPAPLSKFLTGETFKDICGITHTFNDLDRRRVDLCQLLGKTCAQVDAEPQTTFPH
ncbi:MAG TPA: hypothetical protein VOA87_15290 [Thermoanaerobaculia bacterium]|nr:hypothetical protein [Thermoanaerobaculia bacterium]